METTGAMNQLVDSPRAIAGSLAIVAVAYYLFQVIYSVALHPLRKVPGPWYAAASRIPYARHVTRGSSAFWLKELHEKYGNIVRYSPNEVSVINGDEAWPEVYGFRTGKQKGTAPFLKDTVWYAPPVAGQPSMLSADEEGHGRQRRIVSHAFSDRSIKNQEGLIQKYADLLVNRLKNNVTASSNEVDIGRWYNWATFDVIADLTFGEPFGCLAGSSTHPYVDMIIRSVQAFGLYYCMVYWPLLKSFAPLFLDTTLLKTRQQFNKWIMDQTVKRIESDTDRPDFYTAILERKREEEEKGREAISVREMMATSSLFMAAGTETTATTLACATYLMLKHPNVYNKVKAEVRGRFKAHDDITIDAANTLPYTIATLTEALRLMPPVPAGFIRKVPKTGGFVSGYFLPGNCNASVSMTHYASYRSETNFADANTFDPDRWLSDPINPDQPLNPRYARDNKATFQPFSFGPRNCLGKNLAYAEMRVFFAKIVWNFDLELNAECLDWESRCNVKTLWTKPELLVKATPVVRD